MIFLNEPFGGSIFSNIHLLCLSFSLLLVNFLLPVLFSVISNPQNAVLLNLRL